MPPRPERRSGARPPLRWHADFAAIAEELHSRPAPLVNPPASISHLALQCSPEEARTVVELVAELCRRYGAPPPFREHHHAAQLGRLELRLEQHTEFASLTFLRPGDGLRPFVDTALELVPKDWLARLPGRVVAALHLVVEPRRPPPPGEIDQLFEGQRVRASLVMGAAVVWTDWRTHGDGFDRFYVAAQGLDPFRAGRLVQRLVELDTYRMLALLGLPLARKLAPSLRELEEALGRITRRIGESRDIAAKRALLGELFDIAASAERMATETAFRFGATRAYHQLVRDRLHELGEQRFDPYQPLGQFLVRRFEPAMRTCQSVHERIASANTRISRAADLVRTRVDVELQEQNQKLLASMERRAALQLRLQETVEGLSVVVLSYYTVGLLDYLVQGLVALGLAAPAKSLVPAAAVPLVVAGVWLSVRWLRRRLHRHLDQS